MNSILTTRRLRLGLAVVAILALGTTIVLAGTTVTVTKTKSYSAYAYDYDGDTRVQVSVSDMGNGDFYLYCYIYDYSTYTVLERWYGYISGDDVTTSNGSLVLNTDTTDYDALYPDYVVGDGGPIVLEWSIAPGDATSQDSKVTYRTAAYKRISFGGSESGPATVEGTVFGEDFVSAGSINSNYGKQIVQMFD